MSTKHSKAAGEFLKNRDMAAWHDETLWMVRAKRDKMSREVPRMYIGRKTPKSIARLSITSLKATR